MVKRRGPKRKKLQPSAHADEILAMLCRHSLSKSAKHNIMLYARHYALAMTKRSIQAFPLSAQSVLIFLSDSRQRYGVNTMLGAIWALDKLAQLSGWKRPLDDPRLREIVKTLYENQPRGHLRKPSFAQLRQVALALPESSPAQRRDKALFLLCAIGGLRPHEIRDLDRELVREPGAIRLLPCDVRVCEGDNPGSDPVRALLRWREDLGDSTGALFPKLNRSGNVREGTRLTARQIGLCIGRAVQSVLGERFMPGQIRSALTLELADRECSLAEIANVLRFKNPEQVLYHTGMRGKPYRLHLGQRYWHPRRRGAA
jgi:hypothetical protein